MSHLLAQFGTITNPFQTLGSPLASSQNGSGLVSLANVLIKGAIIVAGIYALFNLIFAGYGFMSAGGDAKQLSKAWEKIWQSLIGLLIVAGSLVLSMLIGFLLFGNPTIFINPQLYTP